MHSHIKIFIFLACTALITNVTSSQLQGSLKKGAHNVGFKILNVKDDHGKALRICIWYPAKEKGTAMKLSDYVDIPSIGGSQEKKVLRNELKNTLSFAMDIPSIPQSDFDKALTTDVLAVKDAIMETGKWPVIISDCEPTPLVVTNEYLASHGYIVALPAMQYPPPTDDRTLYSGPTFGLESLLNFMLEQSYVDENNISALGFGGGACAAFYLTMKTNKIRLLVNIEGGLFMAQSKITLSPDYFPGKITATILHIVNPHIISSESADEFNAVRSKKFRLTEQVQLQHHDFTIYGRIVNGLLHQRGQDAEKATMVYTELHDQILYFLKNEKIDDEKIKNPGYFKLEVF
jgi:hypothetical protein